MCAFALHGRTLLASGGGDGVVRIWDHATGAPLAVLESHTGPVSAVCALTLDGRILLASGADDRTIRIWDATTTTWLIVPVHHPVRVIVYAPDALVAVVAAGLLAVHFQFRTQ